MARSVSLAVPVAGKNESGVRLTIPIINGRSSEKENALQRQHDPPRVSETGELPPVVDSERLLSRRFGRRRCIRWRIRRSGRL